MTDIIDYEGLLKEWRKRLGLSEWRIALAPCCKAESMKLNGTAGCTEWEESTKVALIQILDPKEYGEQIEPFDFEKTLVHELLHLKTCLVSDQVEPLQERYMHQMISDLSRALVDAKRFVENANDIAVAPNKPMQLETRLPSWGEWLSDVGVFQCDDGEWKFVKANDLIPADIAQKLGIEPKDGVLIESDENV